MNGKAVKRIRAAARASKIPGGYARLKREYKELPYHRRPRVMYRATTPSGHSYTLRMFHQSRGQGFSAFTPWR